MESRLTTLNPLQLCERWKIDEAKARLNELKGAEKALAEGFILRFSNPELSKDRLSYAAGKLDGEWGDKAKIWLACAYWATGEQQEAEATLECVEPQTNAVQFLWGYTRSVIEPRRKQALAFLKSVEPLMDGIDNPMWKGNFYLQRGFLYRRLKKYDDAILAYTAAMYWYDQNDDPIRVSEVKNNLAGVYRDAKDFETAHRYVDEAINSLPDVQKAQAYDTKAGIFIDERKYAEAESYALKSIGILENTDRKRLMAESLVTLAQCVSGLGRHSESSGMLDRAAETARYLNNHDLLIFVLQGRIKAATIAIDVCRQESVRIAVETTSSARLAADKLDVSHAAVIQYLAKHKKTD